MLTVKQIIKISRMMEQTDEHARRESELLRRMNTGKENYKTHTIEQTCEQRCSIRDADVQTETNKEETK